MASPGWPLALDRRSHTARSSPRLSDGKATGQVVTGVQYSEGGALGGGSAHEFGDGIGDRGGVCLLRVVPPVGELQGARGHAISERRRLSGR